MAAADVEYRCFVGGLAWATDNASLQQAFASYGDVLDSKVRLLRVPSRLRAFCDWVPADAGLARSAPWFARSAMFWPGSDLTRIERPR